MPQWGLDKSNPMGGTTPADLQRIFAAQWYNSDTNPVISGGTVTGRGDLSYAYSAGVALVKTANGVIYVTWPAGVTALVSQPSVTRTDVIYVTGTGAISVGTEGSVNESTVAVIDRMKLNAGSTSTSSATRARSQNFALPYGASLGWVAGYGEFRSGTVPTPETMFDRTFWVPTDSKIDVIVKQAVYGDRQSWPDSDARSLGVGWVRYTLKIDNVLQETFELTFNRGYSVGAWEYLDHEVTAGQHSVKIERISKAGAPALFFGGGTEKLSGGFVGVRHTGVSD